MKLFVNPAMKIAAAVDGVSDAFDRLTFLGWRGGLAAILAGLATSFVLFGYALAYWRNADMDFMVIYNALLLDAGQPQRFFDHPAYLTIIATQSWFRLLHGLGLLEAWTLPALPAASDRAAFDAAMTQAVHAGRLLALLLAAGAVLIFAGLVRRIVVDWRVALIAVLSFALSGGIAVHSRILRSELLAACPVIFALMILMVIGPGASTARPLLMAVAAALCVLGLENKVQAILLIGALPLLGLAFGAAASASTAFWRRGMARWLAVLVIAALAIAAGFAASPLLATGLDPTLLDAAHFHPVLAARFGIYQTALLALIGLAMIAFAMIWRVSAAETLASLAAVTAGAALALLALEIDYAAGNVIAVINPLEKMLSFADVTTTDATASGAPLSATAWLLLDGLGAVLARYSFVLHASPRPTVFLTWLIVPGIFVAWRRGETKVAIQSLLLLGAAIGIDTLGVRRGLKSEYFIFTDPLIILAGAVLLERLRDLRFRRATYPIAMVLFGIHIAVGQAEPVKYALMRRGPEAICQWRPHYLPQLALPWCGEGPP
jgi:hypothetical protein